MAKIQDVDLPYLEFGEAAAPGTPASAVSRIYVKSDGLFYSKDDAGAETRLAAGAELDYVQYTSPVAITATSEATANTVVTATAITFDGSTAVMIEFYAPTAYSDNVASVDLYVYLYDGSSSIGLIYAMRSETTQRAFQGIYARRRLTPSAAAHTYSIRAALSTTGDGSVSGGAGGAAAEVPGFIRITRV